MIWDTRARCNLRTRALRAKSAEWNAMAKLISRYGQYERRDDDNGGDGGDVMIKDRLRAVSNWLLKSAIKRELLRPRKNCWIECHSDIDIDSTVRGVYKPHDDATTIEIEMVLMLWWWKTLGDGVELRSGTCVLITWYISPGNILVQRLWAMPIY